MSSKNNFTPITVLDVETSQGFDKEYIPICSIAFCTINLSDRKKLYIKDKKSFLVKPPKNEYDPETCKIHNIYPKDTKNSPTFKQLWEDMEKYFTDKTFVAHNADFDSRVIENELKINRIPVPNTVYTCTLDLAKSIWPNEQSYTLNSIAAIFNIPLRHHDALSDANATASILLKMFEKEDTDSVIKLAKEANVPIGVLGHPPRHKGGLRPFERAPHFKKLKNKWAICGPNDIIDEDMKIEVRRRNGTISEYIILGDLTKITTGGGGELVAAFDYKEIR